MGSTDGTAPRGPMRSLGRRQHLVLALLAAILFVSWWWIRRAASADADVGRAADLALALGIAGIAASGLALLRPATSRLGSEVERLEASEARSRAVLLSALDCIVSIDHEGRIVEFNPAAERVFGYRRDDVLGKEMPPLLIPPSLRERHRKSFARYLATGESRVIDTRVELTGLRADGSEFPVELTVTRVRLPGPPVFTAYLRDITGPKRAEASLRQATRDLARTNRELERSNRELEQFAYVASHDLQEPLRMVSSFLQLLGRRYQDRLEDEGKEMIRHATAGADRMRQLIRDLLAYSRIGSHGQAFAPTDLARVLELVLDNLKLRIAESGARVAHDPLPTVLADESQMIQLVQNLIDNAIKFRSARPPEVHLSAAPETGGSWLVRVRDNGIGIEPVHRERVFGMFQRLHGRDEFPGTGIGLAVCRRIVERHGGRIWVEPSPASGSTFCFTIADRGGPA